MVYYQTLPENPLQISLKIIEEFLIAVIPMVDRCVTIITVIHGSLYLIN